MAKSFFTKDDLVVSRKMGDEMLLFPICRKASEIECFYVLNPIAARIWDLLDLANSPEELLDLLLLEYDGTREEARRDVSEFLRDLEAIGALRRI